MKKLLFIIPNLSTGGTNSSLNSLYPQLKTRYMVQVFSISHEPRDHHYSFDEVLLPRCRYLSLVYSDLNCQHGWLRIFAVFLKITRYIFRLAGVDMGALIGKNVLRKLEKKNEYDWVIAFQEGYTTKITSFLTNPNKIAWIHCNYDSYLPKKYTEERLYFLYKKIVCVSEYTASVFARRYPILLDRVVANHNLIDSKRILHMAEEPIEDTRFVASSRTILSVGRFAKVKRFREIPSVAYALKEHGLQFLWYVIGPCDGTEEGALFAENVRKFQVEDCVISLGEKTNPYPYFKAADLYVCLSESEACPMVFKEAQLLNMPIVTTDFPSSYEFVHSNEGIITTIDKLSDSIVKMIQMLDNGFRIQKEKDDARDVTNKLYNILG